MGLCCAKCRSTVDKRKYLRTSYSAAGELSVEFQNLMDDDSNDITVTQYGAVLTEEERGFISERKFRDLVIYQKKVDAEIDAQLLEQEEELRLEEESFLEAKRHAARVAKQLRDQADIRRAWTTKPNDEIVNGEEDFEKFLESVRKRSLSAKTVVTPHVVGGERHKRAAGGGGDSVNKEDWSPDPDWDGADFVSASALSTTKTGGAVGGVEGGGGEGAGDGEGVGGVEGGKISASSSEAER